MDLKNKLSEVIEQTRSNPGDSNLRLTLIQYLCMCGKWDQALKQINQFQKLFPEEQKHVMLYLIENIKAEMRREAVFSTQQKPKTLETHSDRLDILQKQLSLLAYAGDGKNKELADTFSMLSEQVNEVPVKIAFFTEHEFSGDISGAWLMDGDVRTAFVHEYFYRGNYYWQTWNSIRQIAFKKPESFLDIIWRPAEIQFHNGENIQCTCPARYVVLAEQAEKLPDAALSCAKTEWLDVSQDLFTGIGQKMLFTEQHDFGFLDIRIIVFQEQ